MTFTHVCTSRAEFQVRKWKERRPLLVGACGESVLRNLLNVSCGEKLSDLLYYT